MRCGGDEIAPAAVPIVAHHRVGPARERNGDRVAREATSALVLGGGLDEIFHHLENKNEKMRRESTKGRERDCNIKE